MEKRNIILLDIDYITKDGKAVVRLFGKIKGDEDGKNIIAIDGSFEPYIYVICNDLEACISELEELNPEKIEIVSKKNFQVESKFLKITFNHPQDVPKMKDSIKYLDSVEDIREHDIPFYRRYLIDNNIFPMSELEITGELLNSFTSIKSSKKPLEIMEMNSPPKMISGEFPDFRIMSFDLEVYNPKGMPNAEKNEIIMIGISSNVGISKVISTKGKDLDYVEKVETEKEMIEKFAETVKENNIDIIVGYNSDNFDFPYLNDRAKLLGVELDLGMDGSILKFLRRGYTNAATLKGLIHIDLYLLMRRYISLDRYTLERVYLELFGEEKFDIAGDKIWQYWDSEGEDLEKLFEYSLDDVVATLKIAEHTLPLSLELTRLIGQPLFDLTRLATGQQAEWYLVRKAFEYNEIIPNKPAGGEVSSRRNKRAVGGYVKEPESGLHENLVQFDFRSLYPSIIISKNISPDVLLTNSVNNIAKVNENSYDLSDDDYYISPEYEHKFAKEPQGFIPSVIGNVLDERLKIKKRMKKSDDPTEKRILYVQQDALKRLANTMYGIYGFSRFRWYSMECARSITAWGRNYIKNSIKKAEEFGFHTIYADTDGFYAKYEKKACVKNLPHEKVER